jgi:hypothetical protein
MSVEAENRQVISESGESYVIVDRVSCPDTDIQRFERFARLRPVCPDTEIQVLPDVGVPVDWVSCPDTEIQVFPDYGLTSDSLVS